MKRITITAKNALNRYAQGLKIEGESGDCKLPFPRIRACAREIGSADLIIIFVKAYDTAAVLHSVRELVAANTILLTLQNGIGNAETLREAYPHNAIVAGTTAQGATLGCGHIRHAGAVETAYREFDEHQGGGSAFHAKLIRDLL